MGFWQWVGAQSTSSSTVRPPLPVGQTYEDPVYEGPFQKDEYLSLPLVKIEAYNHNTSKFTFELPTRGPISPLPICSALYTRTSPHELICDDNNALTTRWYTPIISTIPSVSTHSQEQENLQPATITFLIKRYDTGKLTPYIHALQIGDRMEFRGPIQKFKFHMNEFEDVVLIGGGSGITPLLQILNHALPDCLNRTRFKLLYANDKDEDILLKSELEAMRATYPDRLDILYVLERPPEGWTGPTGYITLPILESFLPSPSLGSRLKILICGPPPMVLALAGPPFSYGPLKGLLADVGYLASQVYRF